MVSTPAIADECPAHRPTLRCFGIVVLLSVLGLVCEQWLPGPIRHMVPRPAEFFYLLAAAWSGPLAGLLAAAAALAPEWVRGSDPHAAEKLIMACLEALIFGLATRTRLSPGRCAALFWAPIGIPVSCLFPALTAFPSLPGWLAAAATAASGLLTASAVIYISNALPRIPCASNPRPRNSRPLRSSVLNAILLTTGVTVFVVTIIHTELLTRYAEDEVSREMKTESKLIARSMDAYQSSYTGAIVSLASALGELPTLEPRAIDRILRDYQGAFRGFASLLVAGKDGVIVSSSQRVTADGRDIHATHLSVADRDYFREPLATAKPFLSPGFRGRGFGQEPIAALSAPVLSPGGTVQAVVEGSLMLRGLQTLEPAGASDEKSSLMILDRDGKVLYRSEGLPFEVLSDAGKSPLIQLASRAGQGVFPSMNERRERTLATMLATGGGMSIVLQHSLAGVETRIARHRAMVLVLLLLALLIALWLANRIGTRFAKPLEILAREVSAFYPDAEARHIAEPDRSSSEVVTLIEHWNRLTGRLRESYEALQLRMAETTRALESAQAADRAKTQFLTSMSHELRTPLNGIIGASELLLAAPLPPKEADEVRLMRQSADALLCIIDDVLVMARVGAGKLQLNPATFSLRSLVATVTGLLFPAALAKGLATACDMDPHAPDWIVGDAVRLRQVLTNLLGNAVKFTGEGSVRLEIQRTFSSLAAVELEFRVSDTGIGIPLDAQSHMFQPFFQVENTDSRTFGGTGLGLAITRQLVELMGGDISFESSPGVGSTFHCRLSFEIARAPATRIPPLPARQSANHASVLVVEDHAINRTVVKGMLERLGYEADFAGDGAAGVAAARTGKYAAILMDCQMPGMDGYEATAEIRRQQESGHVPILAMTAHALEGDRERCLAAGMDDYLAKPLELATLADLLARWSPG